VQQCKPATAAAFDNAARDAAAAELDALAIACDGLTWRELRSAIVDWHLDNLANARAQAWIPGMAGARDPLIDNLLGRFYHHQVRTIVARLNAEIADLRTRLSTVLQSVGFYASGGHDGGDRAKAILQRLAVPHRRDGGSEQAPDGTERKSLHDLQGHQEQDWQDRSRLVVCR